MHLQCTITMASNLNYKQVANVSRRKWDVESYEQRAKERQAREEEAGYLEETRKKGTDNSTANAKNEDDSNKEEFQAAPPDAAGPEGSKRAFLRARQQAIDLESKVGTSEMVSADNAVVKSGIGWHCKVCDCFLKDSLTYLDHINGKKHQRKLGFTMRVERSTKDQVLDRLKSISQTSKSQKETSLDDIVDLNELVQSKDEALQREREEKKRIRKERKAMENMRQQQQQQQEEEEKEEDEGEEEVDFEGIDPEMAAMMGFSGFGGGNKNG
ncbi:U4/U6.U5 tri-snRNP component SNU23 [Fistulifera solaris]|uniref:U4/U6.U5 tri-snRNP component SNU23 n=1 Tax=Fistulifera solaris TaxID=1519565 RepID=A0A1Z5KJY6_FISSO|nr:U4/U6.U5 tri-snRNP component SNU23 [Fistulifera solaris]|eukprot:GAX26576.1 U4/U6.U5 tri-snRNP component SNU23 [Fistulifera solaris]